MNYDVYNPTLAARVIYDGITNAKPIRIPAGETVKDVALADHVVVELRRSAALGPNVELDVTESAGEAEPAAAAPLYPEGQFSRPPSAPPERPAAPEAASPPPERKNASRPSPAARKRRA